MVLRTPLAEQVVRIPQGCVFESSGYLQLRSEVEMQRCRHSRRMAAHRLHWAHCTPWYLVHRMKTSALE